MLSRVANNLFWMDRYMERSYGLLNLIITNYNSTLDSGDYSSWNGILKTYMNIDSLEDLYEYDDAISIIDFMLFDELNPNTLINIIKKSRENARGVQEHISKEVWLSSNKFYLNISDRLIRKKFRRSDPIVFLEDLLNFNLMYYSNADLTQERGNAFGFMNLGKYYERTLQSVDFLSYRFNDLTKNDYALQESVFWKNLLLSIGGYQIYLKTYKLQQVYWSTKLEVILLDPYLVVYSLFVLHLKQLSYIFLLMMLHLHDHLQLMHSAHQIVIDLIFVSYISL